MIEDRIERTISVLDAMDGDADAEEDIREDDAGDVREIEEEREPSPGWLINGGQSFGDGG